MWYIWEDEREVALLMRLFFVKTKTAVVVASQESHQNHICGYYGVKFTVFQKHTKDLFSDSPHSVQTWCDCTVYETARNPGNLSLTRRPVTAEHKTSHGVNNCSFGIWALLVALIVEKRPPIPEICLWGRESWGPCSWAKEAEPSTPSLWCWVRQKTFVLSCGFWNVFLATTPARLHIFTWSVSKIHLNLQTLYVCCCLRAHSTCWS